MHVMANFKLGHSFFKFLRTQEGTAHSRVLFSDSLLVGFQVKLPKEYRQINFFMRIIILIFEMVINILIRFFLKNINQIQKKHLKRQSIGGKA